MPAAANLVIQTALQVRSMAIIWPTPLGSDLYREKVGQQLHPAVAILTTMFNIYQQIELNRQKVGGLLDRCKSVLGAIDKELEKSSASASDIRAAVENLIL